MKKIYLLCEPEHSNLGDQAQLMCTLRWLKDNYPDRRVVRIGCMFGVFDFFLKSRIKDFIVFLKYVFLKLTVRKDDIFIGHSGYFFIDHHIGWATYAFIQKYFPQNRMIILPQTVNFYSPYAKNMAKRFFANNDRLTLLCRDELSYNKAKELFGSTKLLLYPDIVTSLIGSETYKGKREGILFCMRNDIEAHYTKSEIMDLAERFGDIRKDFTDTDIRVSVNEMRANRENLILDKIKYFSTFKVIITDRYHGTIFSVIASTPVVVINSADHKLSSGVKWFPKDIFGDYVQFAENLDVAFEKASDMLHRTDLEYSISSTYFKDKYWDRLKDIVQ